MQALILCVSLSFREVAYTCKMVLRLRCKDFYWFSVQDPISIVLLYKSIHWGFIFSLDGQSEKNVWNNLDISEDWIN